MRFEGDSRIHILQGAYSVSNDADAVFDTILGSCVAACLMDPVAKLGGMNHFLLPGERGPLATNNKTDYGSHLMDLLIDDLLRKGAVMARMQAKIFGGAKALTSSFEIGSQNIQFIESYLQARKVLIISRSVGGPFGRKVQFWPTTGRARQYLLDPSLRSVI